MILGVSILLFAVAAEVERPTVLLAANDDPWAVFRVKEGKKRWNEIHDGDGNGVRIILEDRLDRRGSDVVAWVEWRRKISKGGISRSMFKYQFKCNDFLVRLVSQSDYDQSGREVDSFDSENYVVLDGGRGAWVAVRPYSDMEKILHAVCLMAPR